MAQFLTTQWFTMYREESAALQGQLVNTDPPLDVSVQYVLKDSPSGDDVHFYLVVASGRLAEFKEGELRSADLSFAMPYDDWVADFKGLRNLTSQHDGNNISWSGRADKLVDVLAVRNSDAYRRLRERVLMKTDFEY